MNFINRSRRYLLTAVLGLALAAVAFLAAPVQATQAIASPLQASAIVADLDADGLQRQVKGSAEQTQGRFQRGFGDAVDSPRHEAQGAMRELRGKARTNAEEARREAQETGQDLQDQVKSLGDRIKDFFD